MENRNQKTKALVEASMISALTVVISLVLIFTTLDVLASVIIPIPLTIIYIRRNLKYSIGTLLISTILVGIFSNPFQAFASTLIFGAVGICLGYFITKKYSAYKIIGIMGLLIALSLFIYLYIYSTLIYNGGINGMVERMANMTKGLDLSNTKNLAMIEQIKKFWTKDTLLKILPSSLIVGGYIFAYMNYMITKSVLKRLNYEMSEMIQFTKIFIPSIVGASIFIIYLFGVILTMKKVSIGGYLTMSSQIVLQCIFTLQGICVFSYFLLNKYKISKGIIAIIIIVSMVYQLSLSFAIIGLIDLILDFRKIYPNRRLKR